MKSLKIAAFKKNLKTFFYHNNVFEKKMDSLLDYYPTQDPISQNWTHVLVFWIPKSRGEKETLNQLNLKLSAKYPTLLYFEYIAYTVNK